MYIQYVYFPVYRLPWVQSVVVIMYIQYAYFSVYRLPWVQAVVVVVAPSDISCVQQLLEENHLTRVRVAAGGKTRHRSIYNGVKALRNGGCTLKIGHT